MFLRARSVGNPQTHISYLSCKSLRVYPVNPVLLDLCLPHYLSPSLEHKLALLSRTSGKSRDALINMVLENDLDLFLARSK